MPNGNQKKKKGILSLRRVIGGARLGEDADGDSTPETVNGAAPAAPAEPPMLTAAVTAPAGSLDDTLAGRPAPGADQDDTLSGLRRLTSLPGAENPAAPAADRAVALRQLEEELHQRLARWVRLEGELQSVRSALARLEGEHAGVRATLQSADAELTALRTGRDASEQELSAARARNSDLQQELATHRDALLGMQATLQQWEGRQRQHEEEMAALAAHARDLEETLVEVRQRAVTEGRDLEALTQQLAERDARLDDLTAAQTRLQAERTQLQAERDAQRQTIENLQAELRTQKKLVSVIGKGIDGLDEMASTIQCLDEWVSLQVDPPPSAAATADAGPPPPGEQTYRLMETLNAPRTVRYPLYKKVFTIGRSSDSDMRVGGPYTSRHHARILTDGEDAVIEDLGSANGVIVNEAPVLRCVLHDGDVVDIGGSRFRFLDQSRGHGAGVTANA